MEIGEKLFNFELPATDGKEYSNYSFADRSCLLIIVTCNHCPYAQAYWSRFQKLYDKYEEDNIGVLCINPNDDGRYPEDSFENMKKLVMEKKIGFPYLRDASQDICKKLGAIKTPQAFLFNSKRELVYKGAIDDSWENEHMVTRVFLEDAIEYTLDGLEVDFPEIEPIGCSLKWLEGNEPNL